MRGEAAQGDCPQFEGEAKPLQGKDDMQNGVIQPGASLRYVTDYYAQNIWGICILCALAFTLYVFVCGNICIFVCNCLCVVAHADVLIFFI